MHPTEMAFSADGTLLAGLSILRDKEIRVWDLVRGEERASLFIPSKRRLSSLTFAPTGHILVAGGDEGMLFVWDVDAPENARLKLQSSEATTLCLASSPDGRWLAAGDNGGGVGFYPAVVRLWAWSALRSLLAQA
jgi:WD40 repeat protein